MQPLFVDSHAHIYLPEFSEDLTDVIKRAEAAGVKAIYLPAIDSSTHEKMLQTAKNFPICKSMMGLHPCSVREEYSAEITIVKEYLSQEKVIAIGEIGLDFYWDKTFVTQQYDAFHQQIELALQHNLPIAIHSRNATDECISVVGQYPTLRGVFHCFSGNEEQAQKIVAMNFLLGIGGVVTFKNAGLDKVIPYVGLASIILETDAPYLSPVPFRGKRNEPAYTKLVAEKLSTLLNLPVEEVATITTQNAEKLFSLSQNH